jgi:hypothetical protein
MAHARLQVLGHGACPLIGKVHVIFRAACGVRMPLDFDLPVGIFFLYYADDSIKFILLIRSQSI